MFKDRLKTARKNAGLSQATLAEKLFVSQQAVAKWETDRATPNPEMLAKISNILNVSVDYLLCNDSPNNNDIPEDKNVVVLDDEALELMDHLRTRPEMKTLFSVSKNASAEDILKTIKIIEALKEEK